MCGRGTATLVGTRNATSLIDVGGLDAEGILVLANALHRHVEHTPVDVVVIGAGQAGLSAAYHLRRRGFVPLDRPEGDAETFVVLDADAAPGGAWQHRWASLKMATVNGIHELPGVRRAVRRSAEGEP